MINNKNIKKITLGHVAARKGSTGVKNKNLIKINKEEITKTATNLAINCSLIDNVILSTDSSKILNLITKNKKLIKLKRSKILAKNNTPMLPVIKNAIIYFEKKTKKKVSKLVIFDPTSPLRKMKDIKTAIKKFNKHKPDLLLSANESEHNPYFSMIEKKGKYFTLSKKSKYSPGARQHAPKTYNVNTIVWIYSRKAIFTENKRIPKKTLIYETPTNRSIDIDTKDDINRIYFYLNKKKYAK